MNDWNTSRLWLELERRGNSTETVRSVLRTHMPQISAVLHDAGSGVEDFTLHDEGHSFRVAERMVDILPPDLLSILTAPELALLLFSAYLHDIGMSPGRARVSVLRNYILTGTWEASEIVREEGSPSFAVDEQASFDTWLVEHTTLEAGITPKRGLTPMYLRDVDQSVAHYCRSRHNDWSAEWMRRHLTQTPALYNSWIADLIRLCKSHHEGYEELRHEEFNPRPVVPGNVFVNLRYLACMLRVADVIEFDPERTPDVIFRHRGISPASRIYWWKDQEISWFLSSEGRLTISARPPDAKIHKAIEDTIADVERELRVCRRLNDDRDFAVYGGSPVLQHRWHLGVAVQQDIQARNSAYQYIDGAFRPNTRKVLDLLGGLELYGDRLAAVRELLQNAFDAVREQIARQRLQHPEGSLSEVGDFFARTHFVRLRLETFSNGLLLVCHDSGAGMSKELLERFFLVSGTSRRPDIDRLRRECEARKITLMRSGQFGIGVLSYFLLAESIVLKTRRSSETGDADGTGWIFETEGVGSFGELRPVREWVRGTEISLYLRDLGDPFRFSREISKFLVDTVCHTPCAFNFESRVFSGDSLASEPGWSLDDQKLSAYAAKMGERSTVGGPSDGALIPEDYRDFLEQRSAFVREILEDYSNRLKWFSVEETLPGEAGLIRVHIPWFQLDTGGCLAYFRADNKRDNSFNFLELRNGEASSHCLVLDDDVWTSWRGMAVSAARPRNKMLLPVVRRFSIGVVEIDFWKESAGAISVHRRELRVTSEGEKIFRRAEELRRQAILQVVDMIAGNRSLEFVNWRLASAVVGALDSPSQPIWLRTNNTGFSLEPVEFPVVSDAIDAVPRVGTLRLMGEVVTRCEALYAKRSGRGRGTFYLYPKPCNQINSKMTWFSTDETFLPVIVGNQRSDVSWCSEIQLTEFPDIWKHLLVVFRDEGDYWNQNNPIVRGVSDASWKWSGDREDPRQIASEILADRGKACAWIMKRISGGGLSLWQALQEQERDLLDRILCVAMPGYVPSERYLMAAFHRFANKRLLLVSAQEAKTFSGDKALESRLGCPDEAWVSRHSR